MKNDYLQALAEKNKEAAKEAAKALEEFMSDFPDYKGPNEGWGLLDHYEPPKNYPTDDWFGVPDRDK